MNSFEGYLTPKCKDCPFFDEHDGCTLPMDIIECPAFREECEKKEHTI